MKIDYGGAGMNVAHRVFPTVIIRSRETGEVMGPDVDVRSCPRTFYIFFIILDRQQMQKKLYCSLKYLHLYLKTQVYVILTTIFVFQVIKLIARKFNFKLK